VTFAAFLLARSKSDRERDIWRLVAFLGRYAHQPADAILQRPLSELRRLADATGTLLEEEGEAMARASST